MRNTFSVLFLIIIINTIIIAQSPDSVTLTFRTYKPSTPTVYVPGEFNGWGPNSFGVISPGAPSTMTYNATLAAWLKTYTFKIHDPSDGRRTLADSVWQYKFNQGGLSTGWYSDPINPETNPADMSNSVLRMTKLFWFQFYAAESSNFVTNISASLIHANSDSITSINFSYGQYQNSPLTTVDITPLYDINSRSVDYRLSSPIPKSYFMKVVGYNNLGDSVVFSKGGYLVIYRTMPSYVRHGVTLPSVLSNDSVSFRILVPGKPFVLVRIAPFGTNPATVAPIVMRHNTATSSDWWINVKLPAGNYEYVYEIENGKKIYDPYGRWNGEFGSRFSTDSTGLTADNYIWQNTNFQRPPLNKIVIYELNVGEFAGGYLGKPSGAATFTDFIETIPYLDSLGVNAIELMPVTDYSSLGKSGFSWGYDISSYLSLEPGYGTPADFKALVDSAHGRGISVIMDVVYNHLTEASALWQMLPDEVANPYFKYCTDLRYNEDQLCFFKDMDHWTNETQELVYTALKMWIDVYHIDGFRYDYTQGIGWNIADTTKGILGWANKINNDYNGTVYQIAEHLPESPALLYYSGITSGWHDSFHDRLFDEARFRNVPLVDFENLILDLGAFPSNDTPSSPSSYADRTGPVNASVTHDEQSLIYEMKTFQGVPDSLAVVRDKLYAPFMFTSLGIPMLWEGMEFAEPRGWKSDGEKLSYRPVQFSRLASERGQSHYAWYKKLIFQRLHNPALYQGILRKLYKYDSQRVLVWGFEDFTTYSRVMCVANLGGAQQTIKNIPWLAPGNWYDILDQSIFYVSGMPIDSIVIPAYTTKVYSNKPDSVLGIRENKLSEIPNHYNLSQNYPNPFNPVTIINYQLPADDYVSLKVYDILGREVIMLVNEYKKAGSYNVDWNGNNWPSGVYLYRLQTKSYTETKKMILLR
jgi:1,4-alpha-glucan branching enzyme